MGKGSLIWKDHIVGDYQWKFLCMPTAPWKHDRPLPPFFGRNDKLSFFVAAVMGLQHSLAMVSSSSLQLKACPPDRASFLAPISFLGFLRFGGMLGPPFMTRIAHYLPIFIIETLRRLSLGKYFSYFPGKSFQREALHNIMGGQRAFLVINGQACCHTLASKADGSKKSWPLSWGRS